MLSCCGPKSLFPCPILGNNFDICMLHFRHATFFFCLRTPLIRPNTSRKFAAFSRLNYISLQLFCYCEHRLSPTVNERLLTLYSLVCINVLHDLYTESYTSGHIIWNSLNESFTSLINFI